MTTPEDRIFAKLDELTDRVAQLELQIVKLEASMAPILKGLGFFILAILGSFAATLTGWIGWNR